MALIPSGAAISPTNLIFFTPHFLSTSAVAVAERNACAYCLAAHTALGRKAGASTQALSDA